MEKDKSVIFITNTIIINPYYLNYSHVNFILSSQAQVLGDFFKSKDIKFHRAYSSHYPRALGTGHGILEQIHGSGPDKIELCVDPRIRERVTILQYKFGLFSYMLKVIYVPQEAGTLVGTGAEEIWKTFREKLRQGNKVYEIDFHGEEDSSASFIQRQKSFMKVIPKEWKL